MGRMKAILAFLFVTCSLLGQQVADSEIKLSKVNDVVLYFRMQSAQIEYKFMSNSQVLSYIDSLITDTSSFVDSITITGYSSPEGERSLNNHFAEMRSVNVKKSLLLNYPILVNSKIIYTHSAGEDWEGLRNAVRNDLYIPSKENVLNILYDNSLGDNEREAKLKALEGGKPYRYMVENMLHHLRRTTIRMVKKTVAPPVPAAVALPADTLTTLLPPVISYSSEISETALEAAVPATVPAARIYPFKFAIKTNLLYDAALVPNIEAEVYFKQRWSVNLEFQMAWWKNLSKDNYYQIWAAGPEVRYWLRGDATFKGLYAGVYVATAVYDLKYKAEGYWSDYCYSGGLSWGYVWPVGKRLTVEAGLGVGYVTTQYKKYLRYEPMGAHYYYVSTDRTGYFGPTKAKLALAWRFNLGKKNKNER